MTRNCYAAIFLITVFFICTAAQNVYIVAPNSFRLSADESVGVMVPGVTQQQVTLFLQDFPGRKNTFSKVQVTANPDDSKIVKMRVNPGDIPDLTIANQQTKHYVLLVAEGKTFRKEVKVLVGMQSGYMFVQTDKPIYTPSQTVHVRIIPLNEDMLSNKLNFTVQIRNPQNVIVENSESGALTAKHGLYSYNFKFPTTALEGEWSFIVIYGQKIPRNETVTFELKEYTLPTYEIKLKVPEVVVPTDEAVEVEVEAKYVYGKQVDGSVSCRFGVMSETKKIIYVGNIVHKMLQNGKSKCIIIRDTFEEHKQVGWFPKIAGSHLVVEAVVTEKATGDQEKATKSVTLFTNTKYKIDFSRCLSDFQPGLIATILLDIKEVTGKTAPDILAKIEIKDQNGRPVKHDSKKSVEMSNEEGQVAFVVSTNANMKSLHIVATTDDPDLENRLQGKETHIMRASSPTNYVKLDRTNTIDTKKVGRIFISNVYSSPDNLAINYAISSGGHVIMIGALSKGERAQQRHIQFQITDKMVPNFRITLFAVHGGHMLTDSVKFNVENECRKEAKINLDSTFKNAQPGQEGKITVFGMQDTVVGLLAVDSAVFALRNKGLLTKDKMFSKMEEHDLGCGPGGGQDAHSILANAGLLIISDSSTSAPERPSCSERRLYKREIREEVLRQEKGESLDNEEENKERIYCCELALYPDKLERSCEEREEIIQSFHNFSTCAEVFFRCCEQAEHLYKPSFKILASNTRIARPDLAAVGLNQDMDGVLHFVPENEDSAFEEAAQERKDFRETWLFETGVIGNEKRLEWKINVPHSITTWNIQAVGLNPRQGMCVADPVEAVTFKNVFMQIKLPYSVIRNEQIELRATIFNYGKDRIPVVVYMYGTEGLCSEAQDNEKGDRKKIYVSGNGGAQTVAFPVVPLEIGKFSIKFVALSPEGSDKVIKTLNVVSEGIPHEENIVIDIDPSNINRRKKRSIISEKYETRIDEDMRHQVSFIKLHPEHDYIPGTESCYITAIGEKFGPTVHTALNNPDSLIRMPQGCGEQTMAFFAPTLYTLHYLKTTGKMTAAQEENGYKFVREGYKRELGFRKNDGSYAAFLNRPASVWLTAFVAKVFCQASHYVFIDENTICSALDWLSKQQQADGSFTDQHPVIHAQMTGGIKGAVPMTAFVVNAFYKCDCNRVDITGAKEKAVEYLQKALPRINDPYQLAIVTYALSLVDAAEFGKEANNRLLNIARINEGLNQQYWGEPGTPLSVEATSYALLAQMLHNNRDAATSIVNWLNSQRSPGGSFWSTQDTVIALEALAEYSIIARDPEMNLSCNLTSSSDVTFSESITFRRENARVLRSYELKKLGGRLNVEAAGTGFSRLGVQLRYHVPNNDADICKFDISVNVTDAKEELPPRKKQSARNFEGFFPDDMMEQLGVNPNGNPDNKSVVAPALQHLEAPKVGRRSRVLNAQDGFPNAQSSLPRRGKRQAGGKALGNSKYEVNITICVQYLSHADSNMAIVDAGIFTGFTVNQKDLKRIVDDENLPIARYEEGGRSIVFYFEKIPHAKPSCFWFKASREFIVSHMESSVIKVYDYYNPGHSCSQFISPNQHSAIIQTICEGKICKCAEGGCPPKNPFNDVARNDLLELACDKHDFVWKVEVRKVSSDNSSFRSVDVNVIQVFRPGHETRDDLLASVQRQFLGRRTCATTELTVGKTYIIMGKDNEPIQQEDGQLKYNYYLNKQTSIHEWFNVYDPKIKKPVKEKQLQKVFVWLEDQFMKKGGCLH